jgi:hypothetical protein
MSFIQYGYQTEAEIAAAKKQRDLMQLVTEIGQQQAVIVGQLEQLIRGAPPDRIWDRIEQASLEYGDGLRLIRASFPHRLTGPSR